MGDADCREFGRFEGMVIQKLDNLEQKQAELKNDFCIFKKDVYSRFEENSKSNAYSRGISKGKQLVIAFGIMILSIASTLITIYATYRQVNLGQVNYENSLGCTTHGEAHASTGSRQ